MMFNQPTQNTMKAQVDSLSQNATEEMYIINEVLDAVSDTITLDACYSVIKEKIGNVVFYSIGMGGSHIWIHSHKTNNRLMIVTE